MKKFLCVMVAVVLCFGAVLVTASAETPMYGYNGVQLPYPPSSEYKNLLIIRESDDSYTLVASSVEFITATSMSGRRVYAVPDSHVVYYSYNDGWVQYGEETITEYNKQITALTNVIWTLKSLVDPSDNVVYMEGDNSFTFQPIVYIDGWSIVDGLENFVGVTSDTFGVLVPIGIGIMAMFVGLSLIPRVIFKFL